MYYKIFVYSYSFNININIFIIYFLNITDLFIYNNYYIYLCINYLFINIYYNIFI